MTMSAVQSPLFEPVLWQGDGFKILDEIQLPDKLVYLEVREVGQALGAVREMKTRAFGQVLTFLYSGALLAERYRGKEAAPLRRQLAEMTRQFCDARPTFDFRGLGDFFEQAFNRLQDGAPVGATIARSAREFGQQIVRARSGRARFAASLLPRQARVLTHCNVSGELVAVAHFCRELGKEFSVIATETRPYLQGARLTAWELSQAGVSVSLIPDSAVAQVMARGEVNAVIVGADRSAKNGDVINKVGTYPIACMAREYGVPFHALVQDPRSVARGADIPIEERPADELLEFQGKPLVPVSANRLQARYPGFDVTPARLVTHLVGFDDLHTPESFRQKHGATPVAEESPAAGRGRYLLIYGVPPKSQYAFLTNALKVEAAESLLVPEMRPEIWGAQIVAPALLERQAPVTLVSDNMMGTLFAQGEIKKLCLFYLDLTAEGPKGICGSLLAVQLARLHGVPIEIYAGAGELQATMDRDASTFLGMKICPGGVAVRPVEPEVVPWALFKS